MRQAPCYYVCAGEGAYTALSEFCDKELIIAAIKL